MTNSSSPSLKTLAHLKPAQVTFGFLNVIDLPSVGHCGGLLVVSHIGRPIEFHCTAPVAANRAQQIMYGHTYTGFLFADQIGAALVDRPKKLPSILVTPSAEMMPLCDQVDVPVVLAEPESIELPFVGSPANKFVLAGQNVWCPNATAEELVLVKQHCNAFARKLPFDEPFERIAQAIEEAHAVLRAA